MKRSNKIFAIFSHYVCVLAVVCCLTWVVPAKANTVNWSGHADWSAGNGSGITWQKTPGQIEIVFDPNAVVETPFIYIPNSSLNTVVKMDTRNGQILWTFNLATLGLGSSPSRTTVDSEGNVWVGLRSGSHVVAISADGKYLAAVNVGTGPRAVTIDGNGDIWAGGYNDARIVKISKQTRTAIHTISDSRLCTYGATTDSYGNVWTLDRCKSTIAKIDISTGKIVGTYSAPGCYGIAADRKGFVWVASYENASAYQYNAQTGQRVATYSLGARGRGVAIDALNRAWVACSHNTNSQNIRHLARIDPDKNQVNIFNNVGLHTIGIAVDGAGYVWANSYQEGMAYKLRVSDGTQVGVYPVCDIHGTRPCANTGCKPCTSAASSQPYTYSDMTGFQIQTRSAKGTWTRAFDAQCSAQISKLSWTGTTPANTAIKARARTAASQAALANAAWGPYVNNGHNPSVAPGRWIEIELLLETSDIRITPALTSAEIAYNYFPELCDGIDNDCNGQIDENWPDLGQTCKVGIGACEREGKMICDSSQTKTVCSVSTGSPSKELCDGIDNNCNGQVDEDFSDLGQPCKVGVGACQREGKMICAPSQTKTVCSATPGQPSKEMCDGIDNNCNGQIDEDWPELGTVCEVGVGSCLDKGIWICRTDKTGSTCSVSARTPTPEICDGIDNDCNGLIDDGLIKGCETACGKGTMQCVNGQWTACSAPEPTPEICNGKDDDCDGLVDNGLTRVCETICGKGTETCVNGQWVFCDAPKPTPESCDGLDNDCNGLIDDSIPPRKCSGDCGEGVAECINGKWSGCSGPAPEQEICDGKDNDCNGKIDDNLERKCRTACGEGREICIMGRWTICNAPLPSQEICDGKDNDCNGKIDEGEAICPPAMMCHEGTCKQRCRSGECPSGMRCIHGICVSEADPCKDITCTDGMRCVGGRCIELCYFISCPEGQVCENGKCLEDNCYRSGCDKGLRCVDGKCQADPCFNVKCSEDQFCRDGKCINSCAKIACAEGQHCTDGKCTEIPHDPCATVKCAEGQRCVKGECEVDPCFGITCPDGRQCIEGRCAHDPCFNIQCPEGQICQDAECFADSNQKPDEQITPMHEAIASDAGSGSNLEQITQPSPDQMVHTGDLGTSAQADGDLGILDKGVGTPNVAQDVEPIRYQPTSCGCQSHQGSLPILMWIMLLLGLICAVRLRKDHLT